MDVVYIGLQNKCVVLRIQWNWLALPFNVQCIGNASIKLPKLALVAMQLPEKYQEISTFRANGPSSGGGSHENHQGIRLLKI
jgi:hypothetical protein